MYFANQRLIGAGEVNFNRVVRAGISRIAATHIAPAAAQMKLLRLMSRTVCAMQYKATNRSAISSTFSLTPASPSFSANTRSRRPL